MRITSTTARSKAKAKRSFAKIGHPAHSYSANIQITSIAVSYRQPYQCVGWRALWQLGGTLALWASWRERRGDTIAQARDWGCRCEQRAGAAHVAVWGKKVIVWRYWRGRIRPVEQLCWEWGKGARCRRAGGGVGQTSHQGGVGEGGLGTKHGPT